VPRISSNLLAFLALSCLLLPWASLFFRTSLWWNEASYYTHGWMVPFLALILFFKRKNEWAYSISQKYDGVIILTICLFFLLPFRMTGEPDPFWRLPLWMEMSTLCIISFFVLRLFTKHFISLPAWFLCSIYLISCLPWPAHLESKLIYILTNWVSALTTESLLWLGHPAELMGNLILVDRKQVAIDHGCSGIRSFQNLFSFSLFFSIFFRHNLGGFLFNLSSALCFAVFFNFLRALSLSLVFLEFGNEAQENWHDTIGNTYVGLSVLSLYAFGKIFEIKNTGHRHEGLGILKANCIGQITPLSRFIPITLIAGELLTVSWFSWTQKKDPHFTWQVRLDESERIPEEIQKVLLFDYGEQGEMALSPTESAWIIHFGYEQDSAAASLCSRNHPPDFCMGHTGIKLVESGKLVEFNFGQSTLEFRHYAKPVSQEIPLSDLHVFWCSQPIDTRIENFVFKEANFIEKAQWFLSGRLSYERKVILISFTGQKSYQEARNLLSKTLKRIVQPSGNG
jgi:exosortase